MKNKIYIYYYTDRELIPIDSEYVGAAKLTFDANRRASVQVTNVKTQPLPSTGGIGRTTVYTAGILILASAMFFACMCIFRDNRSERRKH